MAVGGRLFFCARDFQGGCGTVFAIRFRRAGVCRRVGGGDLNVEVRFSCWAFVS